MIRMRHHNVKIARKEQVQSRKILFDLLVFSLVMATWLVIRDHYIANELFKEITSSALAYTVILFTLSTIERLTDEAFKRSHPHGFKVVRMVGIHVAGLSVLVLIMIIVMYFPMYVSLLGQVVQMCILIPLCLLHLASPLPFVLGHLHFTELAAFSLIALVATMYMIRRRAFRDAKAFVMRRFFINVHHLEGERIAPETQDQVTSLGFFYRYASYE